MTEHKPPGTSWETWIDAQIRVATEAGAHCALFARYDAPPDFVGNLLLRH